MTRAPNYRLPRQKRYCASFVRALGTERMQLIAGLQHHHALPAYWNDHKLILLKLGSFVARQTRWSGRPCLRKRFKVTDDRIGNAHKPAEEARAQENVEEMAARGWLSRLGSFVHARFFYPFVTSGSSICSDDREGLSSGLVKINICECLRPLCGYRAQREPPDRDRGQGRLRRKLREHWSSDFRPR